MNLLFFSLSIITFLDAFSHYPLIAMDINCESLVWRDHEFCAKIKSNKKPFQYGTWHPFGFDKNGNAVNYVQLLSFEKLNKSSFRLRSKFTNTNNEQIEGKLDVNCQNKDYYIRPNGVMSQRATWAVIPKGSGVEILSRYLCKRTAARDQWGYSKSTSYLWDHSSPPYEPHEVSGTWVQHSDGLGWYNTDVRRTEDSVMYSYFSKSKTNTPHFWVNSSCIENIASIYYQPNSSVEGEWLSPKKGRPGGANEMVMKLFCK